MIHFKFLSGVNNIQNIITKFFKREDDIRQKILPSISEGKKKHTALFKYNNINTAIIKAHQPKKIRLTHSAGNSNQEWLLRTCDPEHNKKQS